MRSEKGVYALVMRLDHDRTITIGKLSTFDFDAGWYVYLGSAHGGGGVKARTDRHRRPDDQKKKKWNVDYFRPFAPISEIWFSHAQAIFEHEWARFVRRMSGAYIPVEKFGANDCDFGCGAHLFHFLDRPFPAAFRADLLSRLPKHHPVYVEFVEPHATDPVAIKPDSAPLLGAYDRGRRLLELRRRAYYDGLEDTPCPSVITTFSRDRVGKQLVGKLATELNVPVPELKQDAKFAEAVEQIVANCGDEAWQVMFEPARPQERKHIMQLSRTADTRQQYRVEQVLEGLARTIAPQNNDPVYDTVAFSEIVSRLPRARGAIRVGAEKLLNGVDPSETAECLLLADLLKRAALALRRFVNMPREKTPVIPRALSREKVWPVLKSRDIKGEVVGKFRLALALTIKCVWDYPEMCKRKLWPSKIEKEKALTEIETILELTKGALQS